MEICSFRQTHVESHEISPPRLFSLSHPLSSSSPQSPRKYASLIFTALDRHVQFSVIRLFLSIHTCMFHIAEIRPSICLKYIGKNRNTRDEEQIWVIISIGFLSRIKISFYMYKYEKIFSFSLAHLPSISHVPYLRVTLYIYLFFRPVRSTFRCS